MPEGLENSEAKLQYGYVRENSKEKANHLWPPGTCMYEALRGCHIHSLMDDDMEVLSGLLSCLSSPHSFPIIFSLHYLPAYFPATALNAPTLPAIRMLSVEKHIANPAV